MKLEFFQEACLVVGFFLLVFGLGFLFCWQIGMIAAGTMLIAVGIPKRPDHLPDKNSHPPPVEHRTRTGGEE